MNGSSGFRGVPVTGAGTSGSSSSGNSVNDMNSALRSHHPYFPRLESLASPLYNTGELTPAGVAAAAAASRLFPAAHLSALHAAAVAAASSVPQTTASHHAMPPPSLSQFHQAAAAAAVATAAANHHSAAARHPLLSPFLYSHLTSPAGYGNQTPGVGSASAAQQSPFVGGHPRHPSYASAGESAFMPAANVPPRFRYLPSTTSAGTATAPMAPPPVPASMAARLTNMLPADRSLSESDFASSSAAAAAFIRARRPSSPVKTAPSMTNIPTSSTVPSSGATPSTRQGSRSDQRPSNSHGTTTSSSATAVNSSLTEPKSATSGDPKKQQKVSGGLLTQPYYPSHFMKGTVIQLANGDLKRVEDLSTEDFVRSAHLTNELKIDTSQVVKIEEKSTDIVLLTFSVGGNKVQVSVEATVEHPFFVIGQGWSSFSPERSNNLYGLPCQRLRVGDVCISLTHRDVVAKAKVDTLGSKATATDSGCQSLGGGASSSNTGTTKRIEQSSSNEAMKQMQLGNTIGGKAASCNEDDERSSKRRKMNAPLRNEEATNQFASPSLRLQQLDQRCAFTPPPATHPTNKTTKARRWSVS